MKLANAQRRDKRKRAKELSLAATWNDKEDQERSRDNYSNTHQSFRGGHTEKSYSNPLGGFTLKSRSVLNLLGSVPVYTPGWKAIQTISMMMKSNARGTAIRTAMKKTAQRFMV